MKKELKVEDVDLTMAGFYLIGVYGGDIKKD